VREKVKDSGEWWVFINHKGKRRSKKIGDKRTANKVARRIRERLAAGDLGMIRDRCPAIATYGQKWLDSPLRGQAESTLVKYKEAFELNIKPHFGSKRLDEIKKRHVKDFVGELKGKELSTSRSQVILFVFSGMFENAIEDELISVNPCQKMRRYCGNDTRKEINPLTPNEVQETLDNATGLKFATYTA
jgi:integrase